MNKNIIWVILVVLIIGALVIFTNGENPQEVDQETDQNEQAQVPEEKENVQEMTFFVTSENKGSGADFGGLSGADLHCQTLASNAGAGDKTWRAYLSAVATGTDEAVNARDRIGDGPWHNFAGVLIANTVEELHTSNNINKETALSEKGETINGRGDTPNVHDILTGSNPDGMAMESEDDTTCSNWTSDDEGSAIVGHHDRIGLDDSDEAKSWNSSHASRGCSLPDLNSTGGGGLLYCFAE